ncbi:MAG: nitroreductase family protein, partial [Muribaculaceae bacterium]|nr:nitroreductase family protein [Muribaculaceae bacterium]
MKKNGIMTTLAAVAVMACAASCTSTGQTAENNKCNATEAVIENIMTRTSVRQFSDKAVTKDTLDLLLRAGMAAPTAVNKQPWAYVAITERQILDSLDAAHPHAHLAGAPAAIVVCGDLERTLEGRAQEYWIQDCSASTENILLAAHAYGLGAV